MIDPSYREMFVVLAKPLTEEFEYPWNYVRMVFWGMLPITILSFITRLAIEPTPEFTDIRTFFSNLSLIMAVLATFIYFACAWHARQLYQAREFEKSDRVRRFRD